MQVTVTARHTGITEAMKHYAEDKARRLSRLYDRITSVDVVLDRESVQHRVEMVVRADHKHTFVAQVDAGDFFEAVDLVIDKLERQLRKHKEKFRNRKHPDQAAGLPGTGEAPSEGSAPEGAGSSLPDADAEDAKP